MQETSTKRSVVQNVAAKVVGARRSKGGRVATKGAAVLSPAGHLPPAGHLHLIDGGRTGAAAGGGRAGMGAGGGSRAGSGSVGIMGSPTDNFALMGPSLDAVLDEVRLAADLGLPREVLIGMRAGPPPWPFREARDWYRGPRRKVLWTPAGVLMLMNVLGLLHKKNTPPLNPILSAL